MRIAAAAVEPVLRGREDCRAVALRLNLGNLGGFPCRSPLRPAGKPSSALPRSTAASSNTCWHTSARQTSPGPDSSPPAASERFHALKALMRSKPDQGTLAGSVPLPACRFASSAFSTKRKHWLNAKREAPTCRRSACSCSRLGASVKLKVVCRLMLPNQIGLARKRRAQRTLGTTARSAPPPESGGHRLPLDRTWSRLEHGLSIDATTHASLPFELPCTPTYAILNACQAHKVSTCPSMAVLAVRETSFVADCRI